VTEFGQDAPLTTSRGKVLDYLGIKIDYCKKGKVTVSMEEYIKKILIVHNVGRQLICCTPRY